MKASAILIACLLTGCAYPAYVEPTGSATATLLIENNTARSASFLTFDDGCAMKGGSLITPDPKGRRLMRSTESLRIRIKADEQFTLQSNLSSPRASCTILVTFIPRKDKAYHAIVTEADNRC